MEEQLSNHTYLRIVDGARGGKIVSPFKGAANEVKTFVSPAAT